MLLASGRHSLVAEFADAVGTGSPDLLLSRIAFREETNLNERTIAESLIESH
jgi:hypothetical protein